MKLAIVLAVVAVILSSLPLFGIQASPGAQQSASITTHSAQIWTSSGASAQTGARPSDLHGQADASASTSADTAVELRPVTCELTRKLDAKSARVGQEVIVKTTRNVRTADGTVIPSGSRLSGHITQVQARGSGHAGSTLGIVFDRATLKGGRSLAIHSVIESVTPPARVMAADAMQADDPFGSSMSPLGSAAMGGGAAGRGAFGGGLVGSGRIGSGLVGGGLTGGAAGTTMSPVGNLASDFAPASRDVRRRAGHAATSGLRETATSSLGTHATAVPGVTLTQTAGNATSGTLSTTKHNLHLDSGTQMVLGIAAVHRP